MCFCIILEKRQVNVMVYYEMKKVFSKVTNKLALGVMAVIIGIVVSLAVTSVTWVDAQGKSHTGFFAIGELRQAQRAWAGPLSTDQIARILEENARINASPEGQSADLTDKEIAYSKTQGFLQIRNLINYSYGGFRDYDYYTADALDPKDAGRFYGNRLVQLKTWLEGEARDIFNDDEKAYLISQYEAMDTPLVYDYTKGWEMLLEYSPVIMMLMVLIIGYMVSGIFSGEFQLRADAVYFSAYHGRRRAVTAKLKAGFLMVTAVFWSVELLYTALILGIFGAGGADIHIQAVGKCWKCFYNITFLQEYVLTMLGGYVGCLFMAFAAMLISAWTKSAVLAVIVPFALIFAPSLIPFGGSGAGSRFLGLLPDQLLQMNMSISYFNLYDVGHKVLTPVGLLFPLYLSLTLLLQPVIYHLYRKWQAG